MCTETSRVSFATLGCRLNQADTEALARRLAAAGYQVVLPREKADVRVVNTCAVTAEADRQSRQQARRARRASAFLVVTGCAAQTARGAFPEADLVVGNQEKEALPDMLRRLRAGPTRPTAPTHLRTRATVKVQEGCNLACSYCIVPQVRGPERSRTSEEVVAEVQALVDDGYQEIILTGTRLGAYDRPSLPGLVTKVLAETSAPRLRLSSLLPHDLTPELLRLWQDARLCRHFHVPLQSGSDRVLHAMRRPYDVAAYARAVTRAGEAVPGLALTTDVIAGFPGEGEADFRETEEICRKLAFARLHVFPFSPRPATAAAIFPQQVPGPLKKERARQLIGLGQRLASDFQETTGSALQAFAWA